MDIIKDLVNDMKDKFRKSFRVREYKVEKITEM